MIASVVSKYLTIESGRGRVGLSEGAGSRRTEKRSQTAEAEGRRQKQRSRRTQARRKKREGWIIEMIETNQLKRNRTARLLNLRGLGGIRTNEMRGVNAFGLNGIGRVCTKHSFPDWGRRSRIWSGGCRGVQYVRCSGCQQRVLSSQLPPAQIAPRRPRFPNSPVFRSTAGSDNEQSHDVS